MKQDRKKKPEEKEKSNALNGKYSISLGIIAFVIVAMLSIYFSMPSNMFHFSSDATSDHLKSVHAQRETSKAPPTTDENAPPPLSSDDPQITVDEHSPKSETFVESDLHIIASLAADIKKYAKFEIEDTLSPGSNDKPPFDITLKAQDDERTLMQSDDEAILEDSLGACNHFITVNGAKNSKYEQMKKIYSSAKKKVKQFFYRENLESEEGEESFDDPNIIFENFATDSEDTTYYFKEREKGFFECTAIDVMENVEQKLCFDMCGQCRACQFISFGKDALDAFRRKAECFVCQYDKKDDNKFEFPAIYRKMRCPPLTELEEVIKQLSLNKVELEATIDGIFSTNHDDKFFESIISNKINMNAVSQTLTSNLLLSTCLGKVIGSGGIGKIIDLTKFEHPNFVMKIAEISKISEKDLKNEVFSQMYGNYIVRNNEQLSKIKVPVIAPYILKITGHENSYYAIFMEKVDGMTIDKKFEGEKRFALQKFLQEDDGGTNILSQIFKMSHILMDAGLHLTDIKAENFMLPNKENENFLILIDFGGSIFDMNDHCNDELKCGYSFTYTPSFFYKDCDIPIKNGLKGDKNMYASCLVNQPLFAIELTCLEIFDKNAAEALGPQRNKKPWEVYHTYKNTPPCQEQLENIENSFRASLIKMEQKHTIESLIAFFDLPEEF